MNQEQNNVPVGDALSNQQVAEQLQNEENQALREYYLRQLRLMCPTMVTGQSDNARLSILKQRTTRLIEMLTLFEHSWTEEMPLLQKTCLSYLTTNNVSKKERQRIIDAWTGWSDFHFKLARHRGLLSQFLQYHHRTGQELESLINTNQADASPETQETV